MKNFSNKEIEAIVMMVLSLGLIVASWTMLLGVPSDIHEFVYGITIGINIPVFFYWLKKLMDDDSR
jgi:hypothetical protein